MAHHISFSEKQEKEKNKLTLIKKNVNPPNLQYVHADYAIFDSHSSHVIVSAKKLMSLV